VAWWLYIADDFVKRQGYEFPGLQKLPSEYFRQSVYLTFIDEPDVIKLAHDRLGIENIMWSSDYPHPVSSWPRSQHVAHEMFGDASEKDRELVLWGNAARVWNRQEGRS
jgi:predicted TIM-barrel fold metal-dependent hydrolase